MEIPKFYVLLWNFPGTHILLYASKDWVGTFKFSYGNSIRISIVEMLWPELKPSNLKAFKLTQVSEPVFDLFLIEAFFVPTKEAF